MTTPQEFLEWIRTLPSTRVPLHNPEGKPLHSIDLQTLAKDLPEHPDLFSWWKGKNMPKHLNNTVAQTILDLDPPENIRAAMLFLMM